MATTNRSSRTVFLVGAVLLVLSTGLAGCRSSVGDDGDAAGTDATADAAATIDSTTTAVPGVVPVDQAAVDVFLAGLASSDASTGIGSANPAGGSGGSTGGVGSVATSPPPVRPSTLAFRPPTLNVDASCLTDGRIGVHYVVTASGGFAWTYAGVSPPGGVVESGDSLAPGPPPPPGQTLSGLIPFSTSITVTNESGGPDATVGGSATVSCTFQT
jgi:hypothetical protein